MFEKGCGDILLIYFEYGILGVLVIFKCYVVDYVFLEVGLGGCYDVINIVNLYVCVIIMIDLDYKEYFGDICELVGYDKVGIFCINMFVIVGDLVILYIVIDYGNEINVDMVLLGCDFKFIEDSEGFNW